MSESFSQIVNRLKLLLRSFWTDILHFIQVCDMIYKENGTCMIYRIFYSTV